MVLLKKQNARGDMTLLDRVILWDQRFDYAKMAPNSADFLADMEHLKPDIEIQLPYDLPDGGNISHMDILEFIAKSGYGRLNYDTAVTSALFTFDPRSKVRKTYICERTGACYEYTHIEVIAWDDISPDYLGTNNLLSGTTLNETLPSL